MSRYGRVSWIQYTAGATGLIFALQGETTAAAVLVAASLIIAAIKQEPTP